MGQVVIAAGPFEELEADVQAVLARSGLDHANAFRQYFVADAIAGDCRDSESLAHGVHSLSREQVLAML
ncbi:hypothetical protein D3C85_1785760 [compost metagenome]